MDTDLVVVGGGPAGLTAAATAARHGVRVVLVDEQPALGGRLLGQLHEAAGPDGKFSWVNGQAEASHLADDTIRSGARILTGTEVWGIWPQWTVYLNQAENGRLRTRALVLASGAVQRPVVLPGWTLPGVMAVGAVQRLLHIHRVTPGRSAVVVGADALAVITARQLALAGVAVRGIVLPPPEAPGAPTPERAIRELARFSSLGPSGLLNVLGRFLRPAIGAAIATHGFPRDGVSVWGVPLMLRRAAGKVLGNDEVRAVEVIDLGPDGSPAGRVETWETDTVVLSGGLAPLCELAQVIGCRVAHLHDLGGTVPLYGANLETTAPGVYVAGSITGVEAAEVAATQGRLAGIAAAARLGALSSAEAAPRLDEAREAITEVRKRVIPFLPNLAEGHLRMEELWQSIHSGAAEAPAGG
ncbi:MAG TPA: FAD-dependent oxidoreductase [bacterium]|nr:FAD-dependent oxidoreductase [bacterium]